MLPYSIFTSTLVFICFHHAHLLDQPPRVTRPPSIIPSQDKSVIYFVPSQKSPVELPCSAEGNDPKTFEWTKNGKLMKINKNKFKWTKNGNIMDFEDAKYISNDTDKSKVISLGKNNGWIQLTELHSDDAGVYQCIAKNEFGTSLSQKFRLVESTTRGFLNPKAEKKYEVLAGSSFKLKCNPPENDPPGFISWSKHQYGGEGTRRVDLDNRVAIDKDGNLYFANIQKSDENDGLKYQCQVELSKIGAIIYGAFSIIKVDQGDKQVQSKVDTAYTSEKVVTGLKNDYVVFQCIFTGDPTPNIEWVRKSGGKLGSHMIKDHTKLRIKRVQYEDEGTYECIGTNAVSKARGIRHTFELKVLSKPEWTAKPQPVDAGEEEQAVFECAAESRPPSKVQWFINGEPIGSLTRNSRRILSEGQLRFINLTRDDAQVVQCNVSNPHGYLWADVALSILAFKPELKVGFKEKIRITEGHDVTLPCEIDGKPKPLIFWKRNNQKIEGPRFPIMPSGNLTILNSTMKDEGNWTCYAENKYGKLESSGELLVRMKTKIDQPPHSRQIDFGAVTSFKCSASTDPDEDKNLEITWLKDGEPLDLSNPRISKNGNEIFINASTSEDTGEYTCVASNKLDSATASAKLKVRAPPDPPTDVSFSSCLSRSAIVSWKPGFDNFAPITNYSVEYNHSYESHIWTKAAIVSDPNKTEASVKLSPHANYTFRVFAANRFGKSKPSQISMAMCDTNPERPDTNPRELRTDRSRPGWLIIKWDEMKPIQHNGDDFRYNLTIKKDGITNRTTISDWTETSKEIYIGKIYEPYEIYIEAWNEKGKSTALSLVHIGYTGEGELLTSPSNFELVPGINVTDKVAVFQWDSIDTTPSMVQGEFRGYLIRYWKLGQKNTTLKAVEIDRVPEDDSRVERAIFKETGTVRTLYPYSVVMAEVIARNTFFESEPSNTITFETEEGVPGRVKSARVVSRGRDHFLLEWEEPEEANGNLTGYEIGYRKVEGVDIGEFTQTTKFDDPYQSHAYLGGLEPDQGYTIYISAKTSKGLGEKFNFDAKTANDKPLVAPEVKIELIGEEFVNISWSFDPNTDAPYGSSHYVRYRETNQQVWKKTVEEKIYTWINVSGLEPNTRYDFSVVAVNSNDQVFSEPITIVTKGEAMQSAEETNLAQSPWFIVMMVLIAVLILFLIIICFIKRSRGEKYNVQEREKLRGNDVENPEKDLFNEYPKSSETDPLAAGSPDSFDNEGDKLPGGSETDSMAEYGDVDPSKFNEDGSFIGQYGSQKPDEKGNQQSAMSTFV